MCGFGKIETKKWQKLENCLVSEAMNEWNYASVTHFLIVIGALDVLKNDNNTQWYLSDFKKK